MGLEGGRARGQIGTVLPKCSGKQKNVTQRKVQNTSTCYRLLYHYYICVYMPICTLSVPLNFNICSTFERVGGQRD